MELCELIQSLMVEDALAARQWIIDANREGVDWATMEQPIGLDATSMAVAAGVVEMLASRSRQRPPNWTANIPAAETDVWLVQMFAGMPRTRKLCQDHGPEPLRRRNVFAPPEFLTAA